MTHKNAKPLLRTLAAVCCIAFAMAFSAEATDGNAHTRPDPASSSTASKASSKATTPAKKKATPKASSSPAPAASSTPQTPYVVQSGNCGSDELTFELYSDGRLYIRGNGPMLTTSTSYSSHATFFGIHTSYIKSVIIEDGVRCIAEHAFYYCKNLTSVTIPESVKIIYSGAFSSCQSLKSVNIPYGVTTIEYLAFKECISLTSIALPSSLTSLSSSAFENCISLTDVYYAGTEEQWNSLRKYVSTYDSLKDVTVHYNANACGASVYYELQNTESFMNSTSTLHLMGSGATHDYVDPYHAPWYEKHSALKSVTIDAGVTRIGTNAFRDCSALKDVYYAGTEAQWNAVAIADGNDALKNAAVHYNS